MPNWGSLEASVIMGISTKNVSNYAKNLQIGMRFNPKKTLLGPAMFITELIGDTGQMKPWRSLWTLEIFCFLIMIAIHVFHLRMCSFVKHKNR